MLFRTGLAAVLGLAAVSLAVPVKIQPDEAASQDTFIYSGMFGDSSADQVVGQAVAEANLGVTVYNGRNGPEAMWSLIHFPLDQINPEAGERVVVGLYSHSPFLPQHAESPSEAFPVSISLYAAKTAWTESSNFNSLANTIVGAGDTPLATNVIDGIGRFHEFDITDSLDDLKAGAYFGFVFQQDAPVTGTKPVGLFAAGAGDTDPTRRPYIAVVPEPTTLGMIGIASLLLRRRRR